MFICMAKKDKSLISLQRSFKQYLSLAELKRNARFIAIEFRKILKRIREKKIKAVNKIIKAYR